MARAGVGAGGYRYLCTIEDIGPETIMKSIVSVDSKFRPLGSRVADKMARKYDYFNV
jgi:hypothetical protein